MTAARILSATEAVQQGKQWSELRSADGWLCWLEFDPARGTTRVRGRHPQHTSGRSILITPDGFSVRSRVHEYGGGSFCLLTAADDTCTDVQLVFVNESDQQLYVQALSVSAIPVMVPTCSPRCRFGDLVPDPQHQRVLAVREIHATSGCPAADVVNELVAVSLTGEQQLLATGKDFYASPRVREDGRFAVWLSWCHPKQPWLSTTLTLASLTEAGEVSNAVDVVNSAGEDMSVFQPEFDAAGHVVFVCDQDVSEAQDGRDGWWYLYRYLFDGDLKAGQLISLPAPPQSDGAFAQAEFGVAQWQLGLRTWAALPELDSAQGGLVASYFEGGWAGLGYLNAGAPSWLMVEDQRARFHSVVAHESGVALLMESATCSTQLVQLSASTWPAKACLDDSVLESLDVNRVVTAAPAQAFAYPVSQQEQAFGFYYPARQESVRYSTPKPPLLIQLHGGPTAMADAALDAQKVFWQQRGFALLVLNYRGSSGFGRTYRHRLRHQWGVTDVEDVQAAIEYAVDQGWCDPEKVFVRGNSAGGYTVLRVLGSDALSSVQGGASYYGISDLLRLNASTHKFESHYLAWLIGDPESASEAFLMRSPIQHGVFRPVIFFQGQNDRVVPPDQTLRLHQQLQHQGVLTEHCLFSGEGHGFRQASHREEVLLRELAFYRRLMA